MTDENAIVRDAQLAIRLELDRRGLPLKVIASKADVSYSTLLSWFPADGTPQIMSAAGLHKLAGAIPSDLLSLLLPDGFHVIQSSEAIDYDEFAAGCHAFLKAKTDAHHPQSPAGRDISDCEKAALDTVVIPLRGKVA